MHRLKPKVNKKKLAKKNKATCGVYRTQRQLERSSFLSAVEQDVIKRTWSDTPSVCASHFNSSRYSTFSFRRLSYPPLNQTCLTEKSENVWILKFYLTGYNFLLKCCLINSSATVHRVQPWSSETVVLCSRHQLLILFFIYK